VVQATDRSGATAPVPYGFRVSQIAAERPDATAIVFRSTAGEFASVTWEQLDCTSNQIARLLADHGVRFGDNVLVALPNGIEHYQSVLAIWKLGACSMQLSHLSPRSERDRIRGLARSRLVLGEWSDLGSDEQLGRAQLATAAAFSDAALSECVSNPGVGMCTGGSTGQPKIVVVDTPWAKVPGALTPLQRAAGLAPNQRQLVSGPLYHNAPFTWSHAGLFEGHSLVVMERFDAPAVAELIESRAIGWMFLVPTMMGRIARVADVATRDFGSLQAIFHASAACPEWVKRFWIERIGPSRVLEGFGPSEGFSTAVISGDEWLAHPGSVGRPFHCDIRILDEEQQPVPQGDVGEIYGKVRDPSGPGFRYIGAPPPKSTPDGYLSGGDLGRFDADGYLYIADRRMDMIIRGGANIYPAEIEGVLLEHPGVYDAVVIGVPHEDLGRTVHAIIRPRDGTTPPTVDELDAFLRERLTPYKLPESYEFADALPRDDAGKIRRSALAATRSAGMPGAVRAPHRAAT
jgi:bile acid-coenzyme A ligase